MKFREQQIRRGIYCKYYYQHEQPVIIREDVGLHMKDFILYTLYDLYKL